MIAASILRVFFAGGLVAALYAQPAPGTIQVTPGQVAVGAPGSAKPLNPDHVVATVNGEKVTVADLRKLMSGAPQEAANSAVSTPKEFLSWTRLMGKLSEDARTSGLDKKSPYRDRLKWSRDQVLSMAAIETRTRDAGNLAEDPRAIYEDSRHKFGSVKVKLLYILVKGKDETTGKAKLEEAIAKFRGGMPFEQVVAKYSDDPETAAKGGDFGELDNSSKVPDSIRRLIFRTKEGDITPPFRQPGGYYVFQPVSFSVKPFEEVQAQLAKEGGEKQMQAWISAERAKVEAKLLHEAFFRNLQATNVPGRPPSGLELPKPSDEIKPDTVLASLNGRIVRADEFTGLMKAVPPGARNNMVENPLEFLTQYGLMERLARVAESEGIAAKEPYRGRVRYNELQILTQARVDEHMDGIVVTVEEQRKGFDENPDRFRTAKIKVLYVAYSLTPPPVVDPNGPKILGEADAQQKIEGLAKQVRSGVDFVTLVQRHSDDPDSKRRGGDMPPISADDPKIPAPIKDAIFATKAGDLAGPVKLPNGYYLIRVEEHSKRTYDQVKDQVYEELRQQRFQKWFDSQRSQFDVQIIDEAAFRQALAG